MKALEELTADIREKLPRLRIELNVTFKRSTQRVDDYFFKSPMLNDVLEWHSKYYSKNSHFEVFNVVMNNEKHSAGVFLDYSEEDTGRFIWDLSKPYLKDQSPELIEFLHGLIN
ncbi:hypothetical protein [Chryseobacterium sp. JK1]|uniref:hypothetical protein n=1 Tax=Chryseobacterium sp. JK1 TaxID=874294 RepID=UPI003D699D8D